MTALLDDPGPLDGLDENEDELRADLDAAEAGERARPQDSAPRPKRGRGRPRKAGGAKKAGRPRSSAPRSASPTKTALRKQIELVYQLSGQGLAMAQPIIGQTIHDNAGPCASAWVDYLDTNPAMRERVEQAMTVGGLAGVIAAHLPIVAALVITVQQAAAQRADQATALG